MAATAEGIAVADFTGKVSGGVVDNECNMQQILQLQTGKCPHISQEWYCSGHADCSINTEKIFGRNIFERNCDSNVVIPAVVTYIFTGKNVLEKGEKNISPAEIVPVRGYFPY